MSLFFYASLTGTVLGFLMGSLSLFLILLILVQRGRGGGLTGALGGPGGQSAFGSKAGDTFTLITVIVAAIWAFTCAFTMWSLGTHSPVASTETPSVSSSEDVPPPGEGITITPDSSLGLDGIGAAAGDDTSGADATDSAATQSDAPSNDDMELSPADSVTETAADDDSATTESTTDADADTQSP